MLVVTLSARSPDEAAASYGFTAEQGDMLAQLLDDRHAAMWQSVLYGVTGGSGDIVEVAASQIGNVGGRPYWSWYGFSGRVEWSACFVSWCANECGYIEAGAVPKFAACSAGVQWFRSAGLWRDRGHEPRSGGIVFFDWGGDGGAGHVGIVESCDGSTVHTIRPHHRGQHERLLREEGLSRRQRVDTRVRDAAELRHAMSLCRKRSPQLSCSKS